VETLALSHAEIDLGRSADQEAMARVLEKEHGGPEGQGYRDGVAFVPRKWINAYEWIHAFEGSRGDMLVHFPGLEEARWEHMSKWLKTVETTPEEWERKRPSTETSRTNSGKIITLRSTQGQAAKPCKCWRDSLTARNKVAV
jgi:hypothetical protein